MDSIVNFGEVIEYEGKEYVYLAATHELIYLARILDHDQTKALLQRSDIAFTSGGIPKTTVQTQNVLYSYVILTTREVEERAAHLARTDYPFNSSFVFNKICPLNKNDHEELRKEILQEGSAAPLGLKSLIRVIES